MVKTVKVLCGKAHDITYAKGSDFGASDERNFFFVHVDENGERKGCPDNSIHIKRFLCLYCDHLIYEEVNE